MTSLNTPHDAFFKQTFSQPKVIHSFLEEYLPPQVLAALDLNHLELQKDTFVDNQLLEQIVLLMLKHIHDPHLPEKLPGIFQQFLRLANVKTAVELLYVVLRYLFEGTDTVTQDEVRTTLEDILGDQGDEIMPTIAERWIEEGMERAFHNSILDLLLLRFDAAPAAISERLSEITDLETLRDLNRQAATAETLAAFEQFFDSLP